MTRLLSGRWLLMGLLLFATAGYALAETLTLTTYYPSPRGVYNELRTMGQTILAQTSGNVGIGTATPSQKLDVAGNVIAPFYYDRDNTGYYLDPAGGSRLNYGDFDNLHAYGTLDANAYAIAPLYYDKNNTGYYLDPDNWSSLNFLVLSNYVNASDVWLRNVGRWASQSIRADQFARMYSVEGNHVSGSGNSFAYCPGIDIRVGCLFSNFDSPGEQLFNYGGSGGPTGCEFHGSGSNNWWATALCIPND